jgi:hypothetical protein
MIFMEKKNVIDFEEFEKIAKAVIKEDIELLKELAKR